MWLDSKTVQTVARNCSLHCRQRLRPGRAVLPPTTVIRSMPPQCGQTGPFGHTMASAARRPLLRSGSVVQKGCSWCPLHPTIERNVGSNPKKDGADVAQAAEKPRKWRKIATLTENPRGDRAEFNHCVRRR